MHPKTCIRCGLEKPPAEFNRHRRAADGLQSHCRPCGRELSKHYNQNNRSAISSRKRAYREKNRDRLNASSRAWQKANPERVAAACALRRSRLYGDSSALSPDERDRIDAIYRQRDMVSEWTGLTYEVDHIIPLARGGKHHPNNLQLLTAFENRSKGASVAPKVGVTSVIQYHLALD